MIIKALDNLIASGGLKTLYIGDGKGRPVSGIRVYTFPRITICLSGIHSMIMSNNGVVEEVFLQPGDCVYLPETAWNKLTYQHDKVFMVIHFLASSVRVLYHTGRAGEETFTTDILAPGAPVSACAMNLIAVFRNAENEFSPSARLCHTGNALLGFVSEYLKRSQEFEEHQGKSAKTWMLICSYLQEHNDLGINLSSVAEHFRLHPAHVSRLFAAHGSEGFAEYLRRLRLEKAVYLLNSTIMDVGEIAFECGFSSPSYFCQVFTAKYKLSPGKFRNNC